MPKHNPRKFYLISAAILIAALSLLFWRIDLNALYAYLAGINIVAFAFYGFDKQQSVAGRSRVPEVVLHALALWGGTPGAFCGRIVFRHKTQKVKFRIVFAAIVILQITIILLYWKLFVAAG